MAKTSEEFVSRLMDKLDTKMNSIREDCKSKDNTRVYASVCECETILGILKEFVELDHEQDIQKTAFRDVDDSDSEDDDTESEYRSTSKKTTY